MLPALRRHLPVLGWMQAMLEPPPWDTPPPPNPAAKAARVKRYALAALAEIEVGNLDAGRMLACVAEDAARNCPDPRACRIAHIAFDAYWKAAAAEQAAAEHPRAPP